MLQVPHISIVFTTIVVAILVVRHAAAVFSFDRMRLCVWQHSTRCRSHRIKLNCHETNISSSSHHLITLCTNKYSNTRTHTHIHSEIYSCAYTSTYIHKQQYTQWSQKSCWQSVCCFCCCSCCWAVTIALRAEWRAKEKHHWNFKSNQSAITDCNFATKPRIVQMDLLCDYTCTYHSHTHIHIVVWWML